MAKDQLFKLFHVQVKHVTIAVHLYVCNVWFFHKNSFNFSISYNTPTAAALQREIRVDRPKVQLPAYKKLAIYSEQKLSNYRSAAIQGPNWVKLAKKCTLYTNAQFNLYSVWKHCDSINFILAFSVWCHYMTQTSVWKSCILDFNLAISSSLDFSFLASWSRSFWFSAYHFNFRLRRSISSLYFSSNCWKEQNFYSCTFKAFSFVFYLESINISVYFPWPHQASNNKAWLNVPFTNNMFTVASKKQSLWI